MPLLAETLALAALFFAIGVGLGWLVYRRGKREG